MIYVFYFVSCIAFIELFIFLDLKKEAMSIVTRSREAVSIVMASELDDDTKEVFIRRASVAMFKTTFVLVIKLLLIIVVLYAMYLLVLAVFPELTDSILEGFVSPIVIIECTFAAIGYAWTRNVVFK